MAGIVNKIGEALHIGGGQKDSHGDHKSHEHNPQHKEGIAEKIKGVASHDDHKSHEHNPEHKEGIAEKIKDKIHGDHGEGQHKKGDKKDKKKKDKKKHGDDHHGHSSSSSDSD